MTVKKITFITVLTIMSVSCGQRQPKTAAEDNATQPEATPVETFKGEVAWYRNFGGNGNDKFSGVTAVADGFIVVGHSESSSFGNGDWAGVEAKESQWYQPTDAIMVKYDRAGNVVWKRNFCESGMNKFHSVTALPDGVLAAGDHHTGMDGGGGALLVKYDYAGNMVWKRVLGIKRNAEDRFSGVAVVPDGIVAVGNTETVYRPELDNGYGDWDGITGKGGKDACIVKFDYAGNVIWKKKFGGSDDETFNMVTAVPDGIVAVGQAESNTFGTGDWEGVAGKGGTDAIIVKYDPAGNVVWKKNFGGSTLDDYRAVIAVPGGVVAAGLSNTFGNGDWEGVTGKGYKGAIIVKYDPAGNVVWKKVFGGEGQDVFTALTTVADGFIAAGHSTHSFGTGDWEGVEPRGNNTNGIIVKFDNEGNVVWKKNFGSGEYHAVAFYPDGGVVAAGNVAPQYFGLFDWEGVTGKGREDAFIVYYK